MPNNTPIPEIPIQDHRPGVPTQITLKPDVDDFLTHYEPGRGDRTHVINEIIRVYRDALPANRRGPLPEAKQQPSDVPAPPKIAEVKKAANG